MSFDDFLTWAVLALMAYAFILRYVLRGQLHLSSVAGSVKDFLASIPWTPPQAAARQEAKKRAAAPDVRYVAERHRHAMRRISEQRRSRITVPAVSVSPEPAPVAVMSSDASRYIPLSEIQQERVRELIGLGWSNNKIYSLLLGTRDKRMAEIKAVRADVDAESLARMIAKADITVPEYVDPQTALQQDAA
jgi:hypothetical protein